MKRRSLVQLIGGLALPASPAFAQQGSGRTIRLIVPLAPGTGTDNVARLLAPRISNALGQPVVVENKVGANGVIGVQEVMKAAPDGTTLLLGSASTLSINMAMLKNPPYDPRRDLTPISGAYVANHAWLVAPNFPARTFAEFIAHAKKNPGKVSVGDASTLVKIQLAALEKMAGIDLLVVPYKSLNTSITDVLGGTLDMTLLDTGAALPMVKDGRMRALAVSSPKRNPLAPDWPAVAEFVPGFDFTSWTAMVGPPGMPRDVVARVNAAMSQAIRQQDVKDWLDKAGMVPWPTTADELKAYIDTDIVKWSRVVKEAQIEQQ